VSFRDFYRRVSSREHFKKRIVSMKGLREFRCSEGSENEGWSRGAWGGGVGPARPGPPPGPAHFFFSQWLKSPQCVARLLCRKQQRRTMYLRIIINQ
jgi:hypothetical protein